MKEHRTTQTPCSDGSICSDTLPLDTVPRSFVSVL
nr:MAG TPA: hypothetical protein [Caudoviricetes sp.]